MGLTTLKIIFSLAVFFTGAFGTLFPWVRKQESSGDRFMIWGDTLAGGALFGAGLLHLLSGSVEGFRSLSPGLSYPLVFLLAGIGFLLILLIEAVLVADPDPNDSPLHCGTGGAGHEIGAGPPSEKRHPYTFILFMVLSVHSIILGLALGTQTSFTSALAVFIAILAHKAMAGFALGVSYRRVNSPLRKTVPVAALFAGMTPLGILTGTAVNAMILPGSRLWFEVIFNSIGAGTFIYIATLDIIRTEFELPGDNWQKWLLATSGFGVMSVLAIWI